MTRSNIQNIINEELALYRLNEQMELFEKRGDLGYKIGSMVRKPVDFAKGVKQGLAGDDDVDVKKPWFSKNAKKSSVFKPGFSSNISGKPGMSPDRPPTSTQSNVGLGDNPNASPSERASKILASLDPKVKAELLNMIRKTIQNRIQVVNTPNKNVEPVQDEKPNPTANWNTTPRGGSRQRPDVINPTKPNQEEPKQDVVQDTPESPETNDGAVSTSDDSKVVVSISNLGDLMSGKPNVASFAKKDGGVFIVDSNTGELLPNPNVKQIRTDTFKFVFDIDTEFPVVYPNSLTISNAAKIQDHQGLWILSQKGTASISNQQQVQPADTNVDTNTQPDVVDSAEEQPQSEFKPKLGDFLKRKQSQQQQTAQAGGEESGQDAQSDESEDNKESKIKETIDNLVNTRMTNAETIQQARETASQLILDNIDPKATLDMKSGYGKYMSDMCKLVKQGKYKADPQADDFKQMAMEKRGGAFVILSGEYLRSLENTAKSFVEKWLDLKSTEREGTITLPMVNPELDDILLSEYKKDKELYDSFRKFRAHSMLAVIAKRFF